MKKSIIKIAIISPLFFLGILNLIVIGSVNEICLNPDCEFPKLVPPIVLTVKSPDQITCVDGKNKIWTSSTGWKIAQGILAEGHSVGDTIIHTQ